MKRNPAELFDQYRKRLKDAAKALKERIAGRFVWVGNAVQKDGSIKRSVDGTYRRKPVPVAEKKAPPHIYRKQHPGETLADFAARRKACNHRRRLREKRAA